MPNASDPHTMTSLFRLIVLVLLATATLPATATSCNVNGINLQVLGSGGTRIGDNRASSAFLVRRDNHALVLVNVGGGAALRFAQSGAKIQDLQAILFTNVQADSTAALPAFVQMSINKHRDSPLPVFGPGRYKTIPSTVALIRALFEVSGGAYRELGKVLTPLDNGSFKLRPKNLDIHFKDGEPLFLKGATKTTPYNEHGLQLTATPVDRSGVPALAWRVDVESRSIVFAGKPMGKTDHLEKLAIGADILVVAVPATNGDSIPVNQIGLLAKRSGIHKLVLTNLPEDSTALEQSIGKQISPNFKGEIVFAKDLDCVQP